MPLARLNLEPQLCSMKGIHIQQPRRPYRRPRHIREAEDQADLK
jgi:hypothetical protein